MSSETPLPWEEHSVLAVHCGLKWGSVPQLQWVHRLHICSMEKGCEGVTAAMILMCSDRGSAPAVGS